MAAPHPRMHGITHVPGGPDPIPGLTIDTTLGFPDYLVGILSNYAYYKLEETGSANWADSSGGGRHLTYDAPLSITRGVAGYVNEDEAGGPLAVYTFGDPPHNGRNSGDYEIGFLADNFFQFSGLAPFTVAFWVNPDFNTGTGISPNVWSWGIMGTLGGDASTGWGWGIFIEPTTMRIDFRRGDVNENGNRLRAVTNLVEDVPSYVMCVWTGTEMQIWLDGVLDNSGLFASDGTTPASPASMGSGSVSTVRNTLRVGGCSIYESLGTFATFRGTLDSIVISDQDLSAYGAELYDATQTSVAGGGVDTIAAQGETGLTGDVTLSEGSNITLTQVGQDIEIAATGGGGGIPTDGWVDDTAATWTYASASTFTVTGDRTAVFRKGTRLKFTQTTVKYGVVANSAHSAGTTTVTIAVNTDYVLANAAISANHYSHILSPEGYPDVFNWAAAPTGFVAGVGVSAQFAIHGRTCWCNIDFLGTSNATTVAFTLPVAALQASAVAAPCFTTNSGATSADPGLINNAAASTACDIYRTLTLAAWTNTGSKRTLGSFEYRF